MTKFIIIYYNLKLRKINKIHSKELQNNIKRDLLKKSLYKLIPVRELITIVNLYYKSIWYNNNYYNNIGLTIDDFPSETMNNYELLDILNKLNYKVTFFIIGSRVNDINLLKKAVSDGHELGNHLKKDINYLNENIKTYIEDLTYTQNIIDKVYNSLNISKKYKLVRNPKGPFGIDSEMIKYLNENNYIHIIGDIYSNDYNFNDDIDYHINYINNNIKSGSIIIMHASNHNDIFNNTLSIISKINNNYNFKTITELLES